MIRAAQLRAARAILTWSEEETARAAGVPVDVVRQAELLSEGVDASIVTTFVNAFALAGVAIVDEPDGRPGLVILSNFHPDPRRAVPTDSAWQVRRAEAFIDDNWDQPLTVDIISAAIGAGKRALFKAFNESRSYTPMTYAKRVRLTHARDLMTDRTVSIGDVARKCRFSNTGHFAADYHQLFGELPSDTRRRAP